MITGGEIMFPTQSPSMGISEEIEDVTITARNRSTSQD